MPVLPPGCSSEEPATIQEFITYAKAALISVGIVRDTVICEYSLQLILISWATPLAPLPVQLLNEIE